MNSFTDNLKAAARSRYHFSVCRGAFTLIEIMITIGLLSFIVLGLLAMFNQTQKAFKAGMTQTDILESGRATMDLLVREMQEMKPSGYPLSRFNNTWVAATNFFSELSPGFDNVGVANPPLLQELTDNYFPRTNLIQRFFFLRKVNQDWVGVGYQVIPDDPNGCVGTLYRFEGTNFSRQGPFTVSGDFIQAAAIAYQSNLNGRIITNLSRIADGIVHLRVRAFATNGFMIVSGSTPGTNGFFEFDRTPAGLPIYTNVWDTSFYGSGYDNAQSACYFMKEAVPAYVEVEMGILEPQILRKYRSIPIAAAQRQYLSNHVAEVHLFRQRIPVRNVDLTAYP